MLSYPGRFRLREAELRRGPHLGWFASGVGLYSFSGELHVVLAEDYATAAGGAPSPVQRARAAGCAHVERAASTCRAIRVGDPGPWLERGVRVVSFAWTTAANAGTLSDSGTGRRFSGALRSCRTASLERDEAGRAIDFLTRDWDLSDAERRRLADRLSEGLSGEELGELELEVPFGPSLDRLIRWVTSGALDEEHLELALNLDLALSEASWWRRTFARKRLVLVEWDQVLASELAAPAPAWSDVGDPAWGARLEVLLPELALPDGVRLPAERRTLFRDAPWLEPGD